VALSLSTSPQWARGSVQYDTYLNSGGFSFTSTVCAAASVAVIPSAAKAATPIITLRTKARAEAAKATAMIGIEALCILRLFWRSLNVILITSLIIVIVLISRTSLRIRVIAMVTGGLPGESTACRSIFPSHPLQQP